MERLTEKFGDKVVLPIIPMEIRSKSDLERFHKARKKYEENTIKLAEYEDIGLSPEEVKQFKDSEEQGLLLRLPCNVGDTVYYIDDCYVYSDKVNSIDIRKENDEYIFTIAYMDYREEDFGKTVFLTQEQAEQKLKEIEHK